MGKILDRVLSIFRSTKPEEKIVPQPTGITRPDAIERRATAHITRQSGIFTMEQDAPLAPEHRERYERIFGPACIRNGYKHKIHLQNDLMNLVLEPGESRVILAVTKSSYHPISRHTMIKEWDPRKTLRDLVAEYERSINPVKYYNSTTDELCAVSEIKVWLQRGQAISKTGPHRPISADDPISQPALVEQDLMQWDRELFTKGMGDSSDPAFRGFGGGEFSGAGAGGGWTQDPAPAIPTENQQFLSDVQNSVDRMTSAPDPTPDNITTYDAPAPDPAPDPPSGDQNA